MGFRDDLINLASLAMRTASERLSKAAEKDEEDVPFSKMQQAL